MQMKALIAFKSKLLSPCRKLSLLFRLKLRKPVFIRALRFHARSNKAKKARPKKQFFATLASGFHCFKQSRNMEKPGELMGVSEAPVHEKKLFPSPVTPAYTEASSRASKGSIFGNADDVEDACRSFENYLVEMIVEEGNLRDLMDVEELLYCWKNLKCPVFIDLVCRFYGELCKDLFSPEDNSSGSSSSSSDIAT